MKTQEQIVRLANENGYGRLFNPDYFKNNEITEDSWLMELALLQKWLREYCWIHLYLEYEFIDSDSYEYAYAIKYFPVRLENNPTKSQRISAFRSLDVYGATYTGAWPTYEEAFSEGIYRALQLIKETIE